MRSCLHGIGAAGCRSRNSSTPVASSIKSMVLKEKLPTMSEDEILKLLATDGMLVKRPLLVGDDFVLVGFKEAEWESCLKTQ